MFCDFSQVFWYIVRIDLKNISLKMKQNLRDF